VAPGHTDGMRTSAAAAGSAVFFALAPGVVAGVVPWALTGWQAGDAPAWLLPFRVAGAGVLAVCSVVLVQAFVRFVREGGGTPAPVAPTERLVVGGWYRHVRNPMYVAVVGAILGQALVLARPVLVVYAAVAGAGMAAFVRWHEEPVLAARYGDEYATYRGHVRPWLPRLRPWDPAGAGH
jgi:protein-S-isoprenylcysteine O-methyltransferase Ste14